MSSFISRNLKKLCTFAILLFPLSLNAASEKERLVDEFIMSSLGALTPEAYEQLAKSTPHPFPNQFAEEQEKFDKLYISHSKKVGEAMQKNQIFIMKKVLTPVYMSSYSEDELNGMLALNKLPVNEKMKKLSPELTGAGAEIGQKFMQMFMGVGLIKTMRLSLAEARQKGLNKELLDKADAVLKENDMNIEEAMKGFDNTTKTENIVNNSPEQTLIDQLLSIQLSEQMKPIFNIMKVSIPNKFESFFEADQKKFNEIFEKNRDQIVNEFFKSFENKMKGIMQALYTKHFNAQELKELIDIQNNPLTKKQMEVSTKIAQMGPEFAKAQEEMQNNPIAEAYIEIFEEAKKQGLKSPKIDQILSEMKAARK